MRIEQSELRDAARQLLTGIGSAGRDEMWTAIRDSGWAAICVPEEFGGLDQPLAAACWLHTEMGRALSPAPLLPSLLAAEALKACPPSALREEWLGRIAAGERVAVSLLDPAVAGLQRSSSSQLSGTVPAVQGASGASHALVAAGSLLALVPLGGEGVSVGPRRLWDSSRDLAELVLTEASVDLLAEGPAAEAAIAALSAHLHFAIAADSTGAAEALLEQTVDYLKERRQFDRPLAMFQALKHRCADLKAAIAGAEALLADHLRVVEQGGDAVLLARAAKALCSTTFRAVAEESVQFHGGMGMTEEHPCHLFLKRALLNEHLASPDDACNLAVGEQLVRSLRPAG
jgi:alkylation response protein AidB-like acyl-CoA dehydrogenase